MTTKTKKVSVYAPIVGIRYVGTFEVSVDATDEEIKEIARKKGDLYVSLCHQCSDGFVDGAEVDDLEMTIEDDE